MRVCRKCGIKIEVKSQQYCQICRIERTRELEREKKRRYRKKLYENKVKTKPIDEVSDKIKECLILISPGPWGKGLYWEDAAKKLNISYGAFRERMLRFRKYYPKEYDNFKSLWKAAYRQNRSLDCKSQFIDEFDGSNIKKKF